MNACAQIIINGGMTPRAFNDFFYYNNSTLSLNKNIQVCYWASQWGGSPYVSANVIKKNGHAMINTNQNWYYVPGRSGYTLNSALAGMKSDSYQQFHLYNSNSVTIDDPAGAMVCIWCDDPNGGTEEEVVAASGTLMAAFAEANPELFPVETKTFVDEGSGVTFVADEDSGIESFTVTEASAPQIAGAKNTLAYDITPQLQAGVEAYQGEVTVSIPVPTDWSIREPLI